MDLLINLIKPFVFFKHLSHFSRWHYKESRIKETDEDEDDDERLVKHKYLEMQLDRYHSQTSKQNV